MPDALTGWQPIASAPKDGTPVDLWMIDQTGNQWREADAYYVTDRWDDVRCFDPETGRCGVREEKRDGWFAPNHDYDGTDGFCDAPRWFNAHPRVMADEFTEPTHWMPLPPPPEGGK